MSISGPGKSGLPGVCTACCPPGPAAHRSFTCCSRAHHRTQNGGSLGGAKPGGFGGLSLRSFERSQKGAEDSPCLPREARRWEWLTDIPKPRRRKAETTLYFASPFTGGPEKVSVPVEIRLHLALSYSTLCETMAFHTASPERLRLQASLYSRWKTGVDCAPSVRHHPHGTE